jgi:hypothetical protein
MPEDRRGNPGIAPGTGRERDGAFPQGDVRWLVVHQDAQRIGCRDLRARDHDDWLVRLDFVELCNLTKMRFVESGGTMARWRSRDIF